MRIPTLKINRIVQIDVTSRCDKACSNCTRGLAQIKKPDMTLAQFEEAVKSSYEWVIREKGVLSLFGGNPCVSKNFEEYCRILAEYLPPVNRGLWTNHLLGKGAIARRCFTEESSYNFNVHEDESAAAEMREWFPWVKVFGEKKSSKHASIFVGASEFVSSETLWDRVSRCSYDIYWSAIIVQEAPEWNSIGGYSCEIASTHARVNGKALGVPITPGWLDSSLSVFEKQYRFACPKCSGCLNLEGIEDNLEIDQFSPGNAQLIQLNWAKTRRGEIVTSPQRADSLPVTYLK